MHFLELYLVDNPLYLYLAAIGFYALNLRERAGTVALTQNLRIV